MFKNEKLKEVKISNMSKPERDTGLEKRQLTKLTGTRVNSGQSNEKRHHIELQFLPSHLTSSMTGCTV